MELKKNLESGFSVSGDNTNRLRTHVWHSKRFTMKELWGFYLPLGLQGRGRGSRAVLRWFKQGVLVHDASCHIAVQLEGPEAGIPFFLFLVLYAFQDSLRLILQMLHHVGVPLSQPMAPVTYMWKPYPNHDREGDGNFQNAVECNDPHVCHSLFRQLWLWMHASAFDEGYNALKLACQKQDPRLLSNERTADFPESASSIIPNNVREDEATELSSSWLKFEGSTIFNDRSLWDANNGISPPVEENVLCMEKHHQLLDFICLDDPKSGTAKTSKEMQCSRSCPLLLLKKDQKGSPIGKKPVAEAFCEAVLLAHLREEQWNEMAVMRRRKEIYVLVRSLRSSVYRLALATIVLERQEEDVNFM
ncbi:hypothetical protein QYF36_018307 [Acer negundo]|nr:hypothetical protein QYF36_018307 [Acer negundo]